MTTRSSVGTSRVRGWLVAGAIVAAVAGALALAHDPTPQTTPSLPVAAQTPMKVDHKNSAHVQRTPDAVPIETSKVFASKDPFEPLVDTGATSTATDDTGKNVATGSGNNKNKDTRETASAANPADRAPNQTSVSVVEVDDATVDVDVEGKVFRVTQGDRFARNFKLLFVDGKCASMLFGDDQFAICEGERVSK